VVVRRIEPGLNAHAAGLRVGDVVTGYARVEIRSLDDFDAAIRRVNRERSTGELGSEAQLELSYWRAGEPHRTSVKVGRLGVRFDPGPSGKALAMHRRRAKLPTQALGEARRAAAHRVHDVDELHARTRVSVLGDAASAEEKTVLSGDRAGLAEIEKVMPGAVVHFACVAHAGTAHRASSANLVLTTPANPTARDYGFLDAQHLHGGRTPSPWPGTLVVLQRCVVETELTLQEGFLQAGANGVVTTLWTTDPVSSAFLFAEFYAALADRRTESVRRALSLARAKTRSATLADVCQRLAVTADEIARDLPRLGAAKATDRPFVHPHYWSGVVMVGR